MVYMSPYRPSRSYYECLDCGHRAFEAHTPGACPRCRGAVKTLSVAQE
ncbi:rubrerythrin-like domain-containing protein [Salinilacihabitans rarus]|nr:rubrerythrin-like domain-containing protein [Salinilacihabitans rarus]